PARACPWRGSLVRASRDQAEAKDAARRGTTMSRSPSRRRFNLPQGKFKLGLTRPPLAIRQPGLRGIAASGASLVALACLALAGLAVAPGTSHAQVWTTLGPSGLLVHAVARGD